MKKSLLERCGLFDGLSPQEIENALHCLGAREKTFRKNAVIFAEGDAAEFFGILIEGVLELRKIDFFGNSNLAAVLYPPEIFAEAAAFSQRREAPFDVVCGADCRVLCVSPKKLFDGAESQCGLCAAVQKNLLHILSEKNVRLTEKIDVLTKRTTREKVLAFLMQQSRSCNGVGFVLPFTRQQMADFLSVDRSALSRELSQMRKEGIINFGGNEFRL